MFELIYLCLKAAGVIDFLPPNIIPFLNALPERVLQRDWDLTMSDIFSVNLIICFFALAFVTVWCAFIYKVTSPRPAYHIWWKGFIFIVVAVFAFSLFYSSNQLITRDNLLVGYGQLLVPSLFMVIDTLFLYLICSMFFIKGPLKVKKAVPPLNKLI